MLNILLYALPLRASSTEHIKPRPASWMRQSINKIYEIAVNFFQKLAEIFTTITHLIWPQEKVVKPMNEPLPQKSSAEIEYEEAQLNYEQAERALVYILHKNAEGTLAVGKNYTEQLLSTLERLVGNPSLSSLQQEKEAFIQEIYSFLAELKLKEQTFVLDLNQERPLLSYSEFMQEIKELFNCIHCFYTKNKKFIKFLPKGPERQLFIKLGHNFTQQISHEQKIYRDASSDSYLSQTLYPQWHKAKEKLDQLHSSISSCTF